MHSSLSTSSCQTVEYRHEKFFNVFLKIYQSVLSMKSIASILHDRNELCWTLVLFILLCAITASFYMGWYHDNSKPQSGIGWADQSYYIKVAQKLAHGETLSKNDFHYQMGYSIIGSVFIRLGASDPYAIVSYLLLIISATFLFYGAREHFSKGLTVLFILIVFFRFGDVRNLEYASEIFLIPWNNQVLFFAFSIYYFAYSFYFSSIKNRNSFLIFLSVVTGFTICTREESIIFLAPLLFLYLFRVSASWRQVILVFGFVILAYSPNLIIKYMALDVVFDNVRVTDHGIGYFDKLISYMNYQRLINNVVDIVFNSSYRGFDSAGRLSLLQSNPWFWLAPLGLVFKCAKKRWLMVYVAVAFFLFLFYLSGENMSVQKLKFHCIRYISPAWISLSFLTVSAADSIVRMTRRLTCIRFSKKIII